MTAPWCGQPLPDDRDGWKTRALAFKESAEEAEAERDAARREVERLKAALEEIGRYALCVVGASEAYGETKSAHLWQEIADSADAALYPPVESPS